MKTKWTVRVINPENETLPTSRLPWLWAELLEREGVLRKLKETNDNNVQQQYQVLEFPAPKGVDDRVWAHMTAERWPSFGIQAVAAPQWGGPIVDPL